SDRIRWENERGNVVGSIRAMTDAALLVDGEGVLLFANREARERLGLDANGLNEGKPLRLLLGAAHPLMQLVEPALSTGTEVRGVAFRLDRAHGERTYLVSIFSLGQAQESAGLLVIMRDLQQVRELESIIEQSSRLARLGGLLSGVAHQIRKPLNVMVLQLELLRQDVEAGKALTPRIERIRHEIRRLDGIIDALMRFMRPEQLRLTQVDVNQLLREIGAQITAKTRVEYQLAETLPSIQADRDLLAEALKNIANNAVEAMAEGGVLSLRTSNSGDGFVTVRISDQGEGIAPENLAHIFNLYFTTKEGGNGLGLSLAARAIDVQGGSIDVASEVGVGTTFTINLPTGQKAHDRLDAQA
ncbi:MAG TPA: ATP-binding protein, partial [Candidatus Binataceae bacterium]|nr:ATP-binding protein [Candidatus Binataceae bacterium]